MFCCVVRARRWRASGGSLHVARLHVAMLHVAILDVARLHVARLHVARLRVAILHAARLHVAILHAARLRVAILHAARLRVAILHVALCSSGKTLAYLLPSLVHCHAQPRVEPGHGPIVSLRPAHPMAVCTRRSPRPAQPSPSALVLAQMWLASVYSPVRVCLAQMPHTRMPRAQPCATIAAAGVRTRHLSSLMKARLAPSPGFCVFASRALC